MDNAITEIGTPEAILFMAEYDSLTDAEVEAWMEIYQPAQHPETCSYTYKASPIEIVVHIESGLPNCNGFVR